MKGLSNIIIELASFQMFSRIESVDYNAISKDHIGDIEARFNDQLIRVQVYTGDDGESIARKIIDNATFENE